MSYADARNHFEKGKSNTDDKAILELLAGLKHLSHAVEEDFLTLGKGVRDIRDIQNGKRIPDSFK
jgi:hypothetical protein